MLAAEHLVMLPCRGKIEANITAVAHGQRTKESVLQEAVQFFKADFMSAQIKKGAYHVGQSPCAIDRVQTC